MACKSPQLISFENQVYSTTTGLSISTICNTGDLVIVLTEGLAISGATSHFTRTKGVLALNGYSFIASSNNQSYSTVVSSFSNKRISHYVYRASDVKVVNFNSATGTSTNPQSVINSDRPVGVLSVAFGTSPINATAEFTTITQNSNFIAAEGWYENDPNNTIVNFSQTSADWITASFSINPTETRITNIEMIASGSTLPGGLQNHDYILRSIYKPNTNTWSSVLPSDWTLLTDPSNANFGIAGFRYSGSNPSTSFGTTSTEYYSVYRNVHRVDPVANSGITSNAPLSGVGNTGIDLFFKNVRKGGIHYLQFYSPNATAQNYFPLDGTTLENIQSGPSIFGGYFSITESSVTPPRAIQATLTNLQYAQSVLLLPLPEYANQSDNKAVIFGSNIREAGPFQEIASGGLLSGGLLINGISIYKTSQISALGGGILSATALNAEYYYNTAQGSVLLSATSDNYQYFTNNTTGSTLLGGSALLDKNQIEVAQGGGILGGLSTILRNINVIAQGGTVSGGSATVGIYVPSALRTSTLPVQVVGTSKVPNISFLGVEVLGDQFDSSFKLRTSTLPTQVVGTATVAEFSFMGIEVIGDRDIVGTGGSVAGGLALIEIGKIAQGGSVAGGLVLESRVQVEVANGGSVADGTILIDIVIVAQGGSVAAGTAFVEIASFSVLRISTVPIQVIGTSKVPIVSFIGVEVLGDQFDPSIKLNTSSLSTYVLGNATVAEFSFIGVEVLGDQFDPEPKLRTTALSTHILGTASISELSFMGVEILGDQIIYGNGTLLAGGSSLFGLLFEFFDANGVVLSGSALVEFESGANIKGSGGVFVSGLNLNQRILNEIAVAGVLIGGESDVPRYDVGLGGIVVGGQNSNELLSNDFGLGGVLLTGNGLLSTYYTNIDSEGGGVLAGDNVNEHGINYGGVVLGSSADVSYSTTITQVYPANDDGYWTASVFNAIDPVVFLGHEPSFGPIKDFFRFRNISIPSSSRILNATLTAITGGSSGGNANIRLYLNASDNALAPTNRLEAEIKELTISNSSWVIPSSVVGLSRISPNINAAVQEVITRSGWAEGNALMVIATPITVSGNNFQTFATIENITYPEVQLTLTYTSGTIYDVFASGGVLIGGFARETYFQFIGTGSVLLSGEADVNPVERYIGFGGVIAGGLSDILIDNAFEILGGVVVGGDSLPFVDLLTFESIGGVVVGSESEVDSGTVSQGGVVIGSSALLNIYDDVEEVLDDDGVVVGGSGLLEVQIGAGGLGSGGLIIGGKPRVYLRMRFISSGMSANAPDYGGVIVGYRNEENPTVIDFEFSLDVNCTWGVDKPIIVDTGIYWNTGQLPLYFYRIVGKARYLDQCDPLYGMGDCCKQFVMNISARSINDLCERLRKRRWKWPVKTVERFSRNAETSLLNVDDNCNILIPVEICDNVLCEEFCIDYDVKETWGFYSKSQVNAFKTHVSTGEIVISGSSSFALVADFSFKWIATNGVVALSGSSRCLSNFAEGSGGVQLGGTAFNQASSWYYTGGNWPFSKDLNPLDTDQFIENVSDRNWTNPEFIITNDDNRAIADTTNGQSTKYLVAKNFNARLPTNAIIVGIEVIIDRHSTGFVKDNAVYLVVGDSIVSDNMAEVSTWPIGVDAIKTYGGLGELWRDPDNIDYLGTWSIADINDSDFGVAIRVEPTVNQLTSETRIDSIQLKLYWEERNQHLRIGGQSLTISKSYAYVGSGVVLIGGAINVPKLGLYFISNGRGDTGPAFSAITMTGNYATSLFFEASGNVDIGGSSQLGGESIIAGGTAYVNSSNYFYTSDGELTVSNTSKIKLNARYRPKGGISLTGIAGFNNIFSFSGNGSLNISGTSSLRSTAFKHISDGNALFALGSSDVNFSNIGTLETHIGFHSQVRDFVFVWKEGAGVVNDTLPNDLINACRCVEMDLIMPMIHNFAQNNKFSQFLQRNNFNISRVLGLKWSRINDSWITNQTFEGYGAAVPDKELWTLIFQLQCTSNIGGLALDTRVWKFSMQVIQKNLRTFVDYDTRLVISFLPDLLCVNGGFDISMDINTQSKDTILTPAATVYDFKLNDNIGLFKNQYWLLNPILKLQLSQKGIDELIARYPLNV
jgi:hypothetical protein